MPDVTQRVNYFHGQLMGVDDFQDEQVYHLDRRRRHNAGLHSPGVVEGLLVSPGGQAHTVTVERGWAVDAQGRELVLATPRRDLPTGGVDVDVWISYPDPEPLSTPVGEAGTGGSARVLEEPVVTMAPPGTVPANALRLARVAGGTVDNGVRTMAGLKNGSVGIAQLKAQLVFDSHVSVPAAVAVDRPAELAITFDVLDGYAFHLVSLHYVGPRPRQPGAVVSSFSWTRRNTLFKLPRPGASYQYRHELLIQNPNTHPITVACRAYRLAEQ